MLNMILSLPGLLSKNMEYRHEYKYILSKTDAAVIKERVAAVLKADPHGENGYEVRSIYFDDERDTYYYQNEDGTDPRVKFRIRAYDGSDRYLVLEKKIKKNGMTKKLQKEISLREMNLLMGEGITSVFASKDGGTAVREHKANGPGEDLFNELMILRDIRLMRPKVIVSYHRTPFIEESGNVRITFDDGILSTADMGEFFNEHIHGRNVLRENETLMELKFDEFLPEYIKEALECGFLNRITFSKYYLCRRYHL
ncbi:MAG TPA: VTC domain-containing protein [Lachnospiraceae bacterium]|nr:VTC domain-containing protein [Lachnospiraceae bacterium]